MVDSQPGEDLVNVRAKTVPGIFSTTNNFTVSK